MKFLFIINKWANFYFFLQNLSKWNILTTRKEYNLLWRKELGPFSQREEKALKKFKEIHQRYPFGKLYFGHYFFVKKGLWNILEKKLQKKDFNNLKEIFFLWRKKFEIFYQKELPLLKNWQKVLQGKLTNSRKLINTTNVVLAKLYSASPFNKEINVYLLPSTQSGGRGWASQISNRRISDLAVLLEISRCSLKEINHIFGIIWHEVIHLYFEKQYFLPLINKEFPNDLKTIDLIKEAANSSLFPAGILAKKILKISCKDKLLHAKISPKYTKAILNFTNEYLEKNNPFDTAYIRELYSILKRKRKQKGP